MDAATATRNPPVLPLGRGGMEQARIPSERDRDGPPVPKPDAQGVFREFHIGDWLVSCQCHNAHANPPRMPVDFALSGSEFETWRRSQKAEVKRVDGNDESEDKNLLRRCCAA